MKDLTLRLIINAITGNARAGLRQIQRWLDDLRGAGARVSAYLTPLFVTLWAQISTSSEFALTSIAAGFTGMSAVAASALSFIRPTFAPIIAGLSSLAAYAATRVPPGFGAMAAGVASAMATVRAVIASGAATATPILSGLAAYASSIVVAGFGAMAAGVSAVMTRLASVVASGASAVNASIISIAAMARSVVAGVAVAFGGLAATLQPIFAQIMGMVAPLIGLFGAWKVISVASDFEQMALRLKGAFNGIMADAKNASNWIKQFAVNTTYSVRQATDAFLMLKGFGLDPMDGTLKKIGDAAAKWSADAGGLVGIAHQLGQAWGRGKLQLQDMNAMIDNGLPVIDLLSTALGRNSQEILDMSEKGELGRDVIRKLIVEMGKQSAGQMTDRMNSLSGAVSNMGDAFDNAIDNIRQKGGFQWITDSVKVFTAITPDVVTTVANMGQVVASVFGDIFAVVGTVFSGIGSVFSPTYKWIGLAEKILGFLSYH